MAKSIIKHGAVVGNGADLNVELGWIPNSVELYNASDGDILTVGYLIPWTIVFTSGGVASSSPTVEIAANSTIKGATSLATATVASVSLSSGSWVGADAAGIIVLLEGSVTGTFTPTGENLILTSYTGTIGTDDATVATGQFVSARNYTSAAAVAGATGTSAIARYNGSAGSASRGFTIGSVIAEEAKLLYYRAFRDDA